MLSQMVAQGLVQINYLAGTVAKDEQMRLKKMIYRATRGKALTHFADIDPADLRDYTGAANFSLRTVYVIVFQDGSTVKEKLMRICDSFGTTRFEIPGQGEVKAMQRKMEELNSRISDSNALLSTTTLRLKEYLRDIQRIS